MSLALRLLVALERRTPGMISCREFEDFIDGYLEGRLSRRERLVFGFHALLCPPCRRYLDRYRRARELGRRVFGDADAAPPDDVPEELVAAVLAARREEGRRP